VAAHGGGAAPVAQVQGDQAQVVGGPVEQLGGPGAHEAVAGAVEAVAAHVVLGVPLVRDGVAVGDRRHRLVEGGVEDRHLGQVGQQHAGAVDPQQVGGHVQRRQVDEVGQVGQGGVVEHHRGAETAPAVHDPVPDAHQPGPLGVGEHAQEVGHGAARRRVVGGAGLLLVAAPQAHHRVAAPDPLGVAGQPSVAGDRVDEGELDRRAAAVEDEHAPLAHAGLPSAGSTQSRTSGRSWRCSTT
jgi:hypothetical protein